MNKLFKNKFLRENLILVIILGLIFPPYAFSDAWVADTGDKQVSRLSNQGHAETVMSVANSDDVGETEIRVNTNYGNPTGRFYPGLKLSFGQDRANVYEIQSIRYDAVSLNPWVVGFYDFDHDEDVEIDSPIYMEWVRAGGFAEPVSVSVNQSNNRVWFADKSTEDSGITQISGWGRDEPPDTGLVNPYYHTTFDAGDTMFKLYSEDTRILQGMKIDFDSDNRAGKVLEIEDINRTPDPNILTTFFPGLPSDHSIIEHDTSVIHIDRFRDKTLLSPQDVSANSYPVRSDPEYDIAWAANTDDNSVVKYEKWNFRRKLSIDYTKIGENLENFPLCVKLNGTRIDYINTQDYGQDIRFTDAEGNPLKYEIEKWNEAGTSIVWVKVPEISQADTTIIYMFYGNPNAKDAQVPENVWDSNYMMVQHLQETDTQIYDSTVNSNNGTSYSNGTPTTLHTDLGQIDGACRFDRADTEYIEIPNSASLSVTGDMTISLWVNVTDFGNYNGLVGKTKINIPAPYDYYLNISDGKPLFSRGDGGVSASVSATTNPLFGVWQYLTVRIIGREVTHYLNGTPNGTGTIILPHIADANKTLRIGSRDDLGTKMEGTIDEVRISDIARPEYWIKACYYSECDTPDTHLITFGDEENIRYAGLLKVGGFGSPHSISVNSSNGEVWVDDKGLLGDNWTDVGGLDDNGGVYSLAVYNDGVHGEKLYGGTDPSGRVYRYDDPDNWADVGRLGTQQQVNSLAVYNGQLYGGTSPTAFVYRYDSGTWTLVGQFSGGVSSVYSLAVYDDKLYAGTDTKGGAAEVYRYESGTTWTDVGWLGSNGDVRSLAVYNGQLYGGTDPSGKVYRYESGTTWTDVGRLGSNDTVCSLAVYNGQLYGGTSPSGKVYRYENDGSTWTDGGWLGSNGDVRSLAVYNGQLYGGTSPSGKVYRYENDGSTWTDVGQLDINNSVLSLAVYNDGVHGEKLYGGTSPSGHVYSFSPSYSPAVVKLSKDGYKTINATVNQYHPIWDTTITLTDTSELDTGIKISFGNNLMDVYLITGIESDTQIQISLPGLNEALGVPSRQWFPVPWLLELSDGEASSPQVAMSSDNAVAVWQQRDSDAPDSPYSIYSNYSIDGGISWHDSQLLEMGSGEASSPQVAMSGGNAVAVWQQNDGTANSIYSNYSSDGGATWHDSQILKGAPEKWEYRKPIFIDYTQIDTDLTDFPLCIQLNGTRIDYINTQDYGQDIRFTDAEGNPLKYEIEKWDETDKKIIWVKIPEISSTDSTVIYMYYGNPDAQDAQDTKNVWDENYKMVQHMKDDPDTSSIKDSTANANDGTKTAANKPIETDGKISEAQSFNEASIPRSGFVDPNGDGSPLEWTPTPSGSQHYTTIDDGVRQPDAAITTDYIGVSAGLSGSTKIDTFSMSSLTGIGSISQVVVWIYGFGSGAPATTHTIQGDIYMNGAWVGYQNFNVTTSYSWKSIPFNGTWTQTDLDNMQIRLRAVQSGAGVVYCAEMYAVITYTPTVNIDMGYDASLNLTTKGTLEAWVSTSGTTDSNMYIVGTEDVSNNRNGYSLSAHQNRILLEIADDSDSNRVDFIPSSSLGTTWHHIAGTWDGTNLELYLDGTNIGTASQTLNPNPISGSGLWIGADPQSSIKRNFNGTIDEVSISDTARSDAWIKAEYNSMIDELITFGDEEETTTGGPIGSVDVAMDGEKAVVVWQQNDGTANNIYYNYSIDGGTNWQNSQLLEISDKDASSPQVAMDGEKAVAVWEESGWITLGGFYGPYGISYDSSMGDGGYIYVAEGVYNCIVKTKIDGSGWTSYGLVGSGVGQFSGPFGIYYDSLTGYTYIADTYNNRIVKTKITDDPWWTTYGEFGTGDGQFRSPNGSYYDSVNGYIYVADTGNNRIIKTKIDGSGWTSYGDHPGDNTFNRPSGIYYDWVTGYIYVADTYNNRIVKTKIDGTGWTSYGTPGSGIGQFSVPNGIYYDSATGFIYVADTGNGRIVKTKEIDINSNIVSSYSIDGGANWGDSQLLELGFGEASSPQVAMSGGNAVAVWQQNDGTANSIYSNYSINGGATWGDSQLLEQGDGEASSPQVAINSDTAVAVWQQRDSDAPDSPYSIYSNYSTDGVWDPADSQLLELGDGEASSPQVAINSDTAVAVWQQQNDGIANSIYYNYSTDGGAAWDAWGDSQLLEQSNGEASSPQVAMSGDSAVAVWQQYDGTANSIFAYNIFADQPTFVAPSFTIPVAKELAHISGFTNAVSVSVNSNPDFGAWVADDDPATDNGDTVVWINGDIGEVVETAGYNINTDSKYHKIIKGFDNPVSVSTDPFSGACWVACQGVDDGDSYIVRLDSGVLALDSYDINGNTVPTYHTKIYGFDSPSAVSVDPSTGECWVADGSNGGQVVKLSPEGHKYTGYMVNGSYNIDDTLITLGLDPTVSTYDIELYHPLRVSFGTKDIDDTPVYEIKNVSYSGTDATIELTSGLTAPISGLTGVYKELVRVGGFASPSDVSAFKGQDFGGPVHPWWLQIRELYVVDDEAPIPADENEGWKDFPDNIPVHDATPQFRWNYIDVDGSDSPLKSYQINIYTLNKAGDDFVPVWDSGELEVQDGVEIMPARRDYIYTDWDKMKKELWVATSLSKENDSTGIYSAYHYSSFYSPTPDLDDCLDLSQTEDDETDSGDRVYFVQLTVTNTNDKSETYPPFKNELEKTGISEEFADTSIIAFILDKTPPGSYRVCGTKANVPATAENNIKENHNDPINTYLQPENWYWDSVWVEWATGETEIVANDSPWIPYKTVNVRVKVKDKNNENVDPITSLDHPGHNSILPPEEFPEKDTDCSGISLEAQYRYSLATSPEPREWSNWLDCSEVRLVDEVQPDTVGRVATERDERRNTFLWLYAKNVKLDNGETNLIQFRVQDEGEWEVNKNIPEGLPGGETESGKEREMWIAPNMGYSHADTDIWKPGFYDVDFQVASNTYGYQLQIDTDIPKVILINYPSNPFPHTYASFRWIAVDTTKCWFKYKLEEWDDAGGVWTLIPTIGDPFDYSNDPVDWNNISEETDATSTNFPTNSFTVGHSYRFTIKAKDLNGIAAGKISPEVPWVWYVSPEVPDTIITYGPADQTTDRSPTFRWRGVGGTPPYKYRYRIDGGSWLPLPPNWDSANNSEDATDNIFDNLSYGSHILQVKSGYEYPPGTMNEDPTPAIRIFTIVDANHPPYSTVAPNKLYKYYREMGE